MKQKITVVKQIKFCASHRLYKYPGACVNIHGHNYMLEIFTVGDELDDLGRLIDFKEIKATISKWVDDNWDHAFIYCTADETMDNLSRELLLAEGLKVFKLSENPTAENMALFLLQNICPQLFRESGVHVEKVRLWETDSSYVEVENVHNK